MNPVRELDEVDVRDKLKSVTDRWSAPLRQPGRHIDWLLLAAVAGLSAVGLAAIYSATSTELLLAGQDPAATMKRQVIFIVAGMVACAAMMTLDYRRLRWLGPLVFIAGIAAVAATFTSLGITVNGARRWLEVGGVRLQPSEVAKFGTLIVISGVLSSVVEPTWRHIVAALALVAVPAGLVVSQPDLGTAIVFVWVTGVLLVSAGTRIKHLAILAGGAAAAAAGAWFGGFIKPYQLERLVSFLDQDNAELARTTLWNATQSKIAVGSGGLFGKGYLEGSQTQLAYVPENHTDFIFTVIGEEFGFVGAAVIIGLFAIVLARLLRASAVAGDKFGTLLAAGAGGLFTLQLFVNIGMTVGLAPVTGLPLPLVTYGGTTTLLAWATIGVCQSVVMRRHRV